MDNVEIARWGFAPDPAHFFSLLAEDVEFDGRDHVALPGAEAHGRGRAVVERFCREYWGTWAEYLATPLTFTAAGDRVVIEVHEQGRGKGSGIPFERHHFQVWTLRDGRLVGWRLFGDRSAAFAAAGL